MLCRAWTRIEFLKTGRVSSLPIHIPSPAVSIQPFRRIILRTKMSKSDKENRSKMALSSLDITFLGTASAQPSSTRNHSSLALRVSGDIWLFDCGEATQQRLQKSTIKMGKINKIFITHTHGDHIFGILPLLASRLNGAGGTAEDTDDPRLDTPLDEPPLEIYGPLGTRAYIRSGLTYTHTILRGRYVVHELRFPSDPPDGDYTLLPLHTSESGNGKNIPMLDGVWPEIFKDSLISVSAAPIFHSVPCAGYVVTELPVPGKMDPQKYLPDIKRTKSKMSVLSQLQRGETVTLSDGTVLHGPPRRPGRKVAILGDTHNPSRIAQLALGADILVHEATNAYLPGVDPNTKGDDTFRTVEVRAKSRGHSTPQMAGTFAKHIKARKLVLNHFSSRYSGNDDVDEEAKKIMSAIADLAQGAFGGDVICARDFMTVPVEFSKSQ